MVMRVKLLVATIDEVYAKLISDNLSEHHVDIIDVSICSALDGLQEAVTKRGFNVALIDATMIEYVDISLIQMPMLLWSENEAIGDMQTGVGKINKYQRVSSIVATILERYAKVSKNRQEPDSKYANITAVWSPAGGVGKTTIALAYALIKVAEDKEVFYLNLENFSSVPGYFGGNSKSISTVFEMLENNDGDVNMLIKGISCNEKGITFLCEPENFDDICILSSENIQDLITACSELTDELVIDLSCVCDARTRKILEIAGKVMIVTEPTEVAEAKLNQFISQNNVYETIKEKTLIVANKGATRTEVLSGQVATLPYVESNDAAVVCKVLSESGFKEKRYDRAI
jgi:cellulose biosynthesis protein BcsQ